MFSNELNDLEGRKMKGMKWARNGELQRKTN